MPSARTEPIASRPRASPSPLQRLNVRLTLVLATIALLALLISGVALSQILPGYFIDQAQRRAQTAVLSTAVLVRNQIILHWRLNQTNVLVPELRNTVILQPAAQEAANRLALGTVTITYGDGTLAARASPDAETRAQLLDAGLQPDPEVVGLTYDDTISPEPGSGVILSLRYQVDDVYTNRVQTQERVTGSLIGAGLAALLVSLLLGLLAARRLTGPLARLRRVTNQFADGALEARAPHFGVLEVDELGGQFNRMADRLSESLRMLEADRDRLREFIADVSHELRTPIAALRTFTELQRDGADLSEEQRREFLDRSAEQISRLEWMSTNLLDLSRIDSGIFPLDMRWGDLRDPARNVVEAQAELAESRGISLAIGVPTSPVMLRFDRERIIQLLTNLVGNALKFTPRGGEVVVEVRDEPEAGIIEVRDSGPGIAPDELPHIFDRFYRGTNVGAARASGSGLGLAIARSIAEMHGGDIEVVSSLGEGATFTVRLPRTVAAAREDQRNFT
ncbi:MAG TPA: HAMP domain-containing sensor histidine kinase [candidate division Zixibacteria bacterium]|nr:HAMP domain-containing sensor histidine kinase [candidate division Zixibacteria bacterium]